MFFLALLTTACESNSERTSYMASTAVHVNAPVIGQDKFKFDATNLDIMEPVGMKIISEENILKNIHKKLIEAENEAELLNVKFSMSNEPVENGLFVFGIESPDSKKLIIEMMKKDMN